MDLEISTERVELTGKIYSPGHGVVICKEVQRETRNGISYWAQITKEAVDWCDHPKPFIEVPAESWNKMCFDGTLDILVSCTEDWGPLKGQPYYITLRGRELRPNPLVGTMTDVAKASFEEWMKPEYKIQGKWIVIPEGIPFWGA